MADSSTRDPGLPTSVSAYADLTRDVFTYGTVSLALAVAHETGITGILCQAHGPLSSTQIAQQGQLKERYVREVLNALAVAGLIQLEEGTGGRDGVEARYHVPDTHRQELRIAGVSCRAISECAKQYAAVKDCFDINGPSCVRYRESTFSLMEDWGDLLLSSVTTAILKTQGLQERLENGLEAAEIGCGTGGLSRHLAAMFPKSQFTATDVVPQPLQRARTLAENKRLTNLTFQLLDVCQVPDDWNGKFDWLFCRDVIHDLPHPLEALKGIFKALKPGGHFSMVDEFVSSYVAENVERQKGAELYSMGTFMCIPESYQQPDSEALGPCWGEEKARELLVQAGFHVLGIRMSWTKDLGTTKVCVCQKMDNS